MREFFGKIQAAIVFVLVILFYWTCFVVPITFFTALWEWIQTNTPSEPIGIQTIWWEHIKQLWYPLNWF